MEKDMIPIPKGRFIYRVQHRIMEGDCQYDHGPRLVEAGPFYADRFPVTNRRFGEFLTVSGYRPEDTAGFLRHWHSGVCPPGLLDHPVTWVSQRDAKIYAAFYGRRLAKDYEWQYIAAGPEKRLYPWGNRFDPTLCNSGDDIAAGAATHSSGDTTPVDMYPAGAGPFGNMDLCGNTWEWVDDEIDDGEHWFTFLRGGCSFKAPHFWHPEGGPCQNNYHLKVHLLNEAINRSGTVSFRCVKDCV
jgi:formylglycine-generating enzyme required for sulfatase activity